jgi:hypothetical protein
LLSMMLDSEAGGFNTFLRGRSLKNPGARR